MKTLRGMALVSLGITISIGFGVLSALAEDGKPEAAATKKSTATDEKTGNDTAAPAADSDKPHKAVDPHGAMKLPSDAKVDVVENNGKLDLDKAHWTVPKSWIRKAPKSPFVQAEYGIPKADGDKFDGRLTISAAGGSIDANIARWKGQFSTKLDAEKEETLDVAGVKITLVDLTGSFNDSRGMTAPPVSRSDYRMLGAIFQLPGEDTLHFIKCSGPKQTIAARADEFKSLLRSLKVDK